MRISNIIITIMCLFLNYGFAHDANKAFFKIEQKRDVVEVRAEFPWSIRSAVLIAFPELEYSEKQEDFDTALFSYLNDNLIITNGDEKLSLLSVVKSISQGHSHQTNYILTFKGNHFNKVTNTIMCNLKKSQSNYHELLFETKSIEYITTNTATRFVVNSKLESNVENYKYYYLGFIIILCFTLSSLYFKKQKSSI